MTSTNKILIIAGMHRSGTSLLASYLQACGLNLGNNLIPPFKDNVKGYFEDIDFVNFHNKLLKKNKANMFSPRHIKFDINDLTQAVNLFESKNKFNIWGWKDPRNTIFLDFWRALMPSAFFLLIFRNPYEVIDSLIRRGTDHSIKRWPFGAAQGWLLYNKKILEFSKNNKDKTVLVNLNDFLKNPENLLTKLNSKFALNLKVLPFEIFFEENLMKIGTVRTYRAKFIGAIYKKKLDALYNDLVNNCN